MASEPFKSSFPPVTDAQVRVLVLGSLPGEVSLERQQYYAHPTNQFWRLTGAVVGADLVHLPYEARLKALLEHHVGLWDVIRQARRTGSLDGNIRDHSPNALVDLVAGLPDLKAIAFNGATSATIGCKQLGAETGLAFIALPSSSAAYTRPFDAKLAEWLAMKPFL
ncbi:DNA-deoxyinosine glycosylase [Asticcacaulis solisilvae]|uniref:DNA-deoxyinosine glycosylase n=1 Tax=Asticcacaulis solisilvae TaxID=1217274 RepID=UPI003FD727DB